MFTFLQWDSPLTLLLELALAVAVILAVIWLARRAKLDVPPTAHALPVGDGTADATEQSVGVDEAGRDGAIAGKDQS